MNEDRINSKKELEEVLKVACGRFVSHTTGTLAEPIITFNSKARAFSASASQLGAQPFAQPERIGETLDKAAALITDGLPKLTQSMALYLGNAVTQSILLKPVKAGRARRCRKCQPRPCRAARRFRTRPGDDARGEPAWGRCAFWVRRGLHRAARASPP